ncbi:hypothetical protein SDC9_121219 [bioreactor metagenome]|uniref:Cupin type-2 domain-containing protein n=1 Tax=bioreactor metagenome TaxID=1076179 RepID=A0A645CBD2_9ZZZZ|nr:cupin domain-containing protein [Paludibacter sp.]
MKIKQSKTFFNQKESPVYKAGEGIQRQFVAYDKDIMVVKVHFEKDAIGTIHTHPHAQATYVVSGVFDVNVGTETMRLFAGDGSFVPSAVSHGCTCIEEGILVEIFTPVREDLYAQIEKPGE